jgi:hypothetical protein
MAGRFWGSRHSGLPLRQPGFSLSSPQRKLGASPAPDQPAALDSCFRRNDEEEGRNGEEWSWSDEEEGRTAGEPRTIFFNSGTQDPQFVPHFSCDCNAANLSSSLPPHPASTPAIASADTSKQVQTCFPLVRTAAAGAAPGASRARP